MKNDLTVLITAAGTQTMPGLADCFHYNGERKIKLIGVDAAAEPSLNQVVDVAYRVPCYDDDRYVDKLLSICEKEKVDVFFPFMDEELELINNNRNRFEELGVKVALPNENTIKITTDKLAFFKWLKDKGISAPEFFEIQTIDDIAKACYKLGYPEKKVCIKERFSSGSRGVRILDEKADLFGIFMNEKPNSMVTKLKPFLDICRNASHIDKLMAMEYLPGAECSVHMLTEKGTAIYTVGWESKRVNASTPVECELRELPIAFQISNQIVSALNETGNIDFDFKYDEKGIPKLMEANPRIAASMSVIAMGGINLPYLRIKQLLGEELPSLKPHYGVKMMRRYIDMFTDEKGEPMTWKKS